MRTQIAKCSDKKTIPICLGVDSAHDSLAIRERDSLAVL